MSDSNRDSDDQETENEKLKRKLKDEAKKYKTEISKLNDEIDQKIEDKRFLLERYDSLKEQFHKINNLDLSIFKECLDTVNKFNECYKAEIISCIANKSQINEEMELSLNCLYVSINIISKYIEHHLPSVLVSDSSLVVAFDGFCNFISTHHLAERICESILYAMCSLMKLSNKDVNKEFWKNKLEKHILNNRLSVENKLASCVILVQLDISNTHLFDIHKYLSDIDLDCCEEYFGFSKSEIISARSSAKKKIENLSKSSTNKGKVKCYASKKIIEMADFERTYFKNSLLFLNDANEIRKKTFEDRRNIIYHENYVFPRKNPIYSLPTNQKCDRKKLFAKYKVFPAKLSENDVKISEEENLTSPTLTNYVNSLQLENESRIRRLKWSEPIDVLKELKETERKSFEKNFGNPLKSRGHEFEELRKELEFEKTKKPQYIELTQFSPETSGIYSAANPVAHRVGIDKILGKSHTLLNCQQKDTEQKFKFPDNSNQNNYYGNIFSSKTFHY